MKLKRQSLTFFALLFLFAAPAFAERSPIHLPDLTTLSRTDELPPAYQGIWDYTLTVKDCETMAVQFMFTGSDTICASEEVVPPDTSQAIVCNFDEITDSGYHFVCSGTIALDDTCSANYNYDITTTLTGSTMTTIGIYTITYEGCGPFLPSGCFRYEYMATKVGNANTECDVPVEAATWSFIKSRYR